MTFKLAAFLKPSEKLPEKPAPKLCPRTDKIRYRTRADTATELAALRKRDPEPDRLRPYRCWSCGDFHIGHGDR